MPDAKAYEHAVLGLTHHRTPHGMAGFVLTNDPAVARSSNQSGVGAPAQRDRALTEVELVDCMVALPGQLFYSTQIPVYPLIPREKQRDGSRHAASTHFFL